MAHVDSAEPPVSAGPPPAPEPPPKKPASVPAGIVVVALAFLGLFVVTQGRTLWAEWKSLRKDMDLVRTTAVIGFPNIHPNPSYARKPGDWYHHEGQSTLLWGGWDGEGHRWFKVGRGDVDRQRITLPIGRDVVQAIDYPVTETGGGTIWGRIPTEAPVVGFEFDGVHSAYPIQVLEKVIVINDTIHDKPFLVLLNPVAAGDRCVRIYEPIVEGHRVTMGTSGYFHDHKPMLYDRGTESLWVETEDDHLESIGGHFKGARLRSVRRSTPVSWGDWRWQNPNGRLLIGADRSKLLPDL